MTNRVLREMQEIKTPEDAMRLVNEQLKPLQAMNIAYHHVFDDHELGVPIVGCELCEASDG